MEGPPLHWVPDASKSREENFEGFMEWLIGSVAHTRAMAAESLERDRAIHAYAVEIHRIITGGAPQEGTRAPPAHHRGRGEIHGAIRALGTPEGRNAARTIVDIFKGFLR